MKQSSQGNVVRLPFQFILMIITGVVVAFCLYRSFKDFTSKETPREVTKVTPQLMEQFGGSPGLVNVGLTINDYLTFDPVKDDFIFIGVVWFEFDPTFITLDLLSKFRFSRAEILEKSEPDARIVNGRFIVRYTVKVHFKNQLLYQYFPFDDHRINLQLINQYVSTGDIIFESVASNFIINAATNALGWTMVAKHVDAGLVKEETQEAQTSLYYPAVLFSINYLRSGIRYAFTILLPLLAIFFISLFAFSLDPVRYTTLPITLSAGSVTALLAYRFVIENLSPAVGYFMLSDFIFFLFLGLVSLIFVFSIILRRFSLLARQLLVFSFHFIVCAMFIYLTFFWMR